MEERIIFKLGTLHPDGMNATFRSFPNSHWTLLNLNIFTTSQCFFYCLFFFLCASSFPFLLLSAYLPWRYALLTLPLFLIFSYFLTSQWSNFRALWRFSISFSLLSRTLTRLCILTTKRRLYFCFCIIIVHARITSIKGYARNVSGIFAYAVFLFIYLVSYSFMHRRRTIYFYIKYIYSYIEVLIIRHT